MPIGGRRAAGDGRGSPMDRAARDRWMAEQDAVGVAAPLPAVAVGARPAVASEVPTRALSVRMRAERAGWRVRTTYARGPYVGDKGTALDGEALSDSLALRMRHPDGRAAVVIWVTRPGKRPAADCAYAWRTDVAFWPVSMPFAAGKGGDMTIIEWIEGTGER